MQARLADQSPSKELIYKRYCPCRTHSDSIPYRRQIRHFRLSNNHDTTVVLVLVKHFGSSEHTLAGPDAHLTIDHDPHQFPFIPTKSAVTR
jgi:hypothetical protein